MKTADVRRELQEVEAKFNKMPGRIAAADAEIKKLRDQRKSILPSAAIDDPGAPEELRRIDRAIADAIRDERSLREINAELHCKVKKLATRLTRCVARDRLEQLPRVAGALSAALKPLAKAAPEIDCGEIQAWASAFGGPVAEYQRIAPAIEAEIRKAVVAAASSALENPEADPRVNLATIEVMLNNLVSACDGADQYWEQRLQRDRMYIELERQRRQEATAL